MTSQMQPLGKTAIIRNLIVIEQNWNGHWHFFGHGVKIGSATDLGNVQASSCKKAISNY